MAYTPRLPPRAHQVEAQRRRRTRPRRPSDDDVFALLADMGTGKSKMILDEFGEREAAGEIQDLLVVAPSGCIRNWYEDRGEDEPSEIRKHLAPELLERLVWAEWRSGMGRAGHQRLEAMLACTGRPRALFVNVEALSTVKKAIAVVARFLGTGGKSLFAVDESTKIKNTKAQRTRTIMKLGQLADARRIMTGLVTPRSPMDLFAQFEFLDWRILGFRSFFGFRARYAIMKKMAVGGLEHRRNVQVIVGYRNIEELQQKIAPYSYRVLKEDCLDLPPKIYMPIRDVRLTDEQQRMYYEMREFATAALDGETHVTATMVLTQRMRLDQLLCGMFKDDDGVEHLIPEHRTDGLMELLEEYSGKATIWTTHDFCIRKIGRVLRDEYGEDSVAQFWGGNRATRGDDERRFKTDPRCRFMVASQSAGGMGNTWIVAGLNVYYNNSDDLQDRLQSEDRTHRDGLMGATGAGKAVYADLCAPGTIDLRKIKNLRRKLDIATQITGENYKEWLI